VQPAQVYHLAALSSVAASFQDPTPTYQTNVMGTLHLLDALRRLAPASRTLVVSSAEVYGGLTNPLPESTPLAPASPYAASKAAAEMIAIQHHRAYGLHVVRARSFNHTGPGQTARFAVSAFARQIARIEVARQAPVLGVGNLAARRDFLDVRDVAQAYMALVRLGAAGEVYNVCSGRAVALQALLDGLLSLAKVGIDVERDPALDRPVDVPELRGDPARLQAATGWRPEIPLEQTLADVLAYWRAKEPFVGDAGSYLA
jgi:GDP-4-dehydro-6-deoxy-D-mannose reductase